MHGILTPICTHYRIQTVNRAPGRTSGIFRACQAIKPMSSPASVPHSRRATPLSNRARATEAADSIGLPATSVMVSNVHCRLGRETLLCFVCDGGPTGGGNPVGRPREVEQVRAFGVVQ